MIPETSTTLLKDISDSSNARWPEFVSRYRQKMVSYLKTHFPAVDADDIVQETLIALAISAAYNPSAAFAMEKLKDLRGCEVHLTHIPTPGDEMGLRKLGVNATSEPEFATNHLVNA